MTVTLTISFPFVNNVRTKDGGTHEQDLSLPLPRLLMIMHVRRVFSKKG